jgi:hypothetical protein
MDLGRIVKWLVVLALLALAWKVAVPWVKQKGGSGGGSVSQGNSSCATAAERASENWGSGLGRFVNPPYDVEAWSHFQSDVESAIAGAESQCTCAAKSCSDIRDAMRELRNLVSEMGTAIRSGTSPPFDAVQRQEAIDNKIAGARALLQSGQ